MHNAYLNVYNIASLVDFHVSREWDDTICTEFTSEQVSGTASVTLCIGHCYMLNSNLSKIEKKTFNNPLIHF